MQKISVLTATRAEYGLLRPVIRRLLDRDDCRTEVLVTGMHLSPAFGLTVRELEADGIPIAARIPILLNDDSPAGVSKAMGLAMIGFADRFCQARPDLLLVLGDRFETLAVCCAALNAGIPIAHLYGGETTEGALDEAYRHAITKMSSLHFTSTEAYRRRVIQLGEAPERVWTVGALGVENALHTPFLEKAELERTLGFSLDGTYAAVTFHPVTCEENTAGAQIAELLRALDRFPEMRFLITKANADAGGGEINAAVDRYAAEHGNVLAVTSLGMQKYLSALRYAGLVIGNSSSGLVEAPSFGIPTVNIGDRQKGRLRGESVIDCLPERESIAAAVRLALTPERRAAARRAENPYGNGETSGPVTEILCRALRNGICREKKFYDLPWGGQERKE